jgi:hypothetical protein
MSLERDGFAWVRGASDSDAVDDKIQRLNRLLFENADDPSILAGPSRPAYGARNLLRLWLEASNLIVESPLLATAVGGSFNWNARLRASCRTAWNGIDSNR